MLVSSELAKQGLPASTSQAKLSYEYEVVTANMGASFLHCSQTGVSGQLPSVRLYWQKVAELSNAIKGNGKSGMTRQQSSRKSEIRNSFRRVLIFAHGTEMTLADRTRTKRAHGCTNLLERIWRRMRRRSEPAHLLPGQRQAS